MTEIPRLTRRKLLKVGAGAGIGALAYLLTQKREIPTIAPPTIETLPPGVPQNTIAPEALKAANVTIHNTPDTKLYLTESAFKLPLFKDAAEGKTGKVIVSLVDNDTISWNAVEKLPEDARLIWQAYNQHPREYSESVWIHTRQENHQRSLFFEQDMSYWQTSLRELTKEQERNQRLLKEARDFHSRGVGDPAYWQSQMEYWESRLKEIPNREHEYRQYLEKDMKILEETRKLAEILKDRPTAINYFAEHGDAIGALINPRRRSPDDIPLETGRTKRFILAKDKKLLDKVFIFLAVGGNQKPHPSQSFPQPEQFSIVNTDDKTDYAVSIEDKQAGFTLRHEVAHYGPQDTRTRNEYEADMEALKSLAVASGAFVFVNDNGITITKRFNDTNSS